MTVMHETRADVNLDAYCTRYVLLNVLTGGNLEKRLLYDGHWTHYHTVLLINRCIQGQTLGLDKLSGGSFLDNTDFPSLASHRVPGLLHLGVRLCEISSITIGMLMSAVIIAGLV